MPAQVRKSRARKTTAKGTSTSRGQTSLLDVFSIHPASKKVTPTTSTAVSENSSGAEDDVIDIPSSDVDTLPEELPVESSSPITVDDDVRDNEHQLEHKRTVFGPANSVGGSRDAPIVIPDSSPAASPVAPARSQKLLASLPPPPLKPLYSIFAPKKATSDRASPLHTYGKPSGKPLAPFPDGTTQHVRGPQITSHIPLTQFSRCKASTDIVGSQGDSSIYSRLAKSSPTRDATCHVPLDALHPVNAILREQILSGIPANHRSYPAVARFLRDNPAPADPSHENGLLWNDKWRPKRADEVLGNEQSALYLRDWLLALKLHIHGAEDTPNSSQASTDRKGPTKSAKAKKAKGPRGTKRPRVVRNVERKKRRIDSEGPEDAWIVPDDSDGDDPLNIIDETFDDDFMQPTLSRLTRAPNEGGSPDIGEGEVDPVLADVPPSDGIPYFAYTPAKFGETVCNTILLSGLSGSGKTASVYACAAELGWDVFEVYPGAGERSGAALQKLIGEVGKNHMVRQTQTRPAEDKARAKARANFFTKRVVSDDEGDNGDVVAAPVEAADSHESPGGLKPEPAAVSQSIVLVEEVDILYREDTNFWPTMVKIIKECRRPVVMTCNDISLVPLEDLPLQSVLHFVPCLTSLASSYLQLACLSENYCLDRTLAADLYEGTLYRSTAIQEDNHVQFLHARTDPPSPPDLRRTLNQLQYGAVMTLRDSHTEVDANDQSLDRFKRIARSIELESYIDSGLRRPQPELLRDLLANTSSSPSDDTLGLKHLAADPSDLDSHLPVTFSTYTRDTSLLHDLRAFTRQHYPSSPSSLASLTALADTPDLPALHTPHCATLLPTLDALHVPRSLLIRDPSAIFTDYLPLIRAMSATDDAAAAAYLAVTRTESTRQTRNSQRSKLADVLWLGLQDAQRESLRQTAFPVDVDDVDVDTKTNLKTDTGADGH